ncbi:MAG TPA: peptide-methionine (S)-S-oxide reductase MsrA [Gemmatimonadales bacterium]|nr:peptide-methionine (S)-S-oxide reductase MsrA [Gemmatimonadales bacterium]
MRRIVRILVCGGLLPLAAIPLAAQSPRQTAVLAGGCFWGIQNLFEHVNGVTRVVAGYAGGRAETASYDRVSSETTGHAESVQITFDPSVVSYETLLDVFFTVGHDPTELNRQGPDVGASYRSAIFYMDEEQRRAAEAAIARLAAAHAYARPVVTQVVPFSGFYRAEEYHQDFATRHPDYPYIVINDLPKVAHLRDRFPRLYREMPVLTSSR